MMTEYEIQMALLETSFAVSDTFQFWMAATFAVVVASYTAGQNLAYFIRGAIALVYIIAIAMFYFRYMDAADHVFYYIELLKNMESEYPLRRVSLISTLRKLLMIGGSLLALVFILSPIWSDKNGLLGNKG